jgi:hypothetical protein
MTKGLQSRLDRLEKLVDSLTPEEPIEIVRQIIAPVLVGGVHKRGPDGEPIFKVVEVER